MRKRTGYALVRWGLPRHRIAMRRLIAHLLSTRSFVLLAILVGAAGALALQYRLDPIPPRLESKTLSYPIVTTQLVVEVPFAPFADLNAPKDSLEKRAALYAAVVATPPVRNELLKQAGLPENAPLQVLGNTRLVRRSSSASAEPSSTEVLLGLPVSSLAIATTTPSGLPLIDVTVRAPSRGLAVRLVNGTAIALERYVASWPSRNIDSRNLVRLRRVGSPEVETRTQGPEARTSVALGLLMGLTVLSARFLAPLFTGSRRTRQHSV